MRRVPIAVLCAMAALLAASWLVPSGAAEEKVSPDNSKALGYLPPGGVLLVQLPTDLDGHEFRTLDARILRRLVGLRVGPLLEDATEDLDLVYEKEIRPQLGNDLAVAARWPALSNGEGGFVAALQVKDGPALRRVLDGNRFLRVAGDADGARLYSSKDETEAFLALEDDVLVVADDERRLRRALLRHDAGTGMNDASFRSRLGDLPRDALIRAVGDVQPLFAQRDLRHLLRIPWVGALRTMSATVAVSGEEVRAEGALDADPSQVGPGDLPIQPGDEPLRSWAAFASSPEGASTRARPRSSCCVRPGRPSPSRASSGTCDASSASTGSTSNARYSSSSTARAPPCWPPTAVSRRAAR